MEDSLLYSESTDYNVTLIHKDPGMGIPRCVYDQISEYCSLAKLTGKINHYCRVFGSLSDLGTHWKGFNRGIIYFCFFKNTQIFGSINDIQ